ncbi:helix-turn-helix domain-containing protein [Profundibacter sp.]
MDSELCQIGKILIGPDPKQTQIDPNKGEPLTRLGAGRTKRISHTKTNWTARKIKYELSLKDWPFMTDIDRRFGLPIGTSKNATLRPEPRGERVIADLLQVSAHVIWPSRYDATGIRHKPQPAASYTPAPVRRQSQN